jgi:hypothetical protein
MVTPVGEVATGVVDDVVRADGTDQIDFRGAAHAGDVRAECFGQLHCVGAHAAGRADDQHGLAWLELAVIAESLQGG